MEYKVLYGIPTFTEFDHCRKAIEGIINSSTRVPDKIVIVDNSEDESGANALTDLTQKYPEKVHIVIRRENILAGAWNDIMCFDNHDYVIIANDDVFPHPHSIEALVNAAENNPKIAMWNGSGHSGNSYSFFLLRQWAYGIVGSFDENFKPAYFEDNDYDWRIKCAGLIREEVQNATFDHVGSATMKSMRDERLVKHHKSFVEAGRYYRRKWGGKPGEEQWKSGFERVLPLDISDL